MKWQSQVEPAAADGQALARVLAADLSRLPPCRRLIAGSSLGLARSVPSYGAPRPAGTGPTTRREGILPSRGANRALIAAVESSYLWRRSRAPLRAFAPPGARQ